MTQTSVHHRYARSPARNLASSTLLVLISAGISQVAAAAAYLLVARSAGPGEFGRVVAATSLILSLVGVVDFGTSSLITREIAAGRMTPRLAYEQVFSRAAVMLGAGIIGAVALTLLGRVSTFESILLCCMALGMIVATGLQGVVRGLGRIQISSWLGASDKCITLLVVLVALLVDPKPSGMPLVLALTVGPSLVAAFMLVWLTAGSRYRVPRLIHPYRGALSFGLTSSVTSVQVLDTTAIASFAGTTAAGQFAAVSRWVAPLNLIVASFTQTAYPALAADPSTRASIRRLRGGLWILGLTWLGAGAVALLSPWLVDILLGPGYDHSASVLSLIVLATIPAAVNQIALTLLQARGDERRAARRITGAVIGQLASVSLGSIWFGSLGAAGAILLSQAALSVVLLVQVRLVLREETSIGQELLA